MIIKTGSIRAISQWLNDHDCWPLNCENPMTRCPRGDTTFTYMPAIIGELVLGAQR
jgi:hypothetical protein